MMRNVLKFLAVAAVYASTLFVPNFGIDTAEGYANVNPTRGWLSARRLSQRDLNPNGNCPTTPIYLTTTGTGTFTPSTAAPGCSHFKIEMVGAGGSAAADGRTGGAGAGYAQGANVTLSGPVSYNVGAGGLGASGTPGNNGGDSWICSATTGCATIGGASVVVGAKGGQGGNANGTTTTSNGGQASACIGGATGGTTNAGAPYCYSGGNALATNASAGGGAGGAAGPSGAGSNGAAAVTTTFGAGGNGNNGTDLGGTTASAAGASGTEFGSSKGIGGGGAGGNAGAPAGGAAGLYGAGSGGYTTHPTPPGAQGIIVITPLSYFIQKNMSVAANDNAAFSSAKAA